MARVFPVDKNKRHKQWHSRSGRLEALHKDFRNHEVIRALYLRRYSLRDTKPSLSESISPIVSWAESYGGSHYRRQFENKKVKMEKKVAILQSIMDEYTFNQYWKDGCVKRFRFDTIPLPHSQLTCLLLRASSRLTIRCKVLMMKNLPTLTKSYWSEMLDTHWIFLYISFAGINTVDKYSSFSFEHSRHFKKMTSDAETFRLHGWRVEVDCRQI